MQTLAKLLSWKVIAYASIIVWAIFNGFLAKRNARRFFPWFLLSIVPPLTVFITGFLFAEFEARRYLRRHKESARKSEN